MAEINPPEPFRDDQDAEEAQPPAEFKPSQDGQEEDDEEQEDYTSRSLGERMAEEETHSRVSEENLDVLYADTIVHGDNVRGSSHRASEGGSVHVASRDQYFYGVPPETETAVIVDLSADDLRVLRHAYVPTDSYRQLTSRLTGEYVLLLGGDAQGGQPTTAMAALLKWAGDGGRVVWLHLGEDPLRLKPADLRPAAGHLLDARHTAWKRPVDQVLGYLNETVKKADGRIVVLVPEESQEHNWSVDYRPPSAEQVFGRWLIRRLEDDGSADPAQWLDKVLSHEQVRAALMATGSPREARILAVRIAGGLGEGRSLEETLAVLPERLREAVHLRMGSDTPRRARCFMIAAAVLHDSPAVTVFRAALRLAALVQEELAGQATAAQPPEPHIWESFPEWAKFAEVEAASTGLGGEGRVIRLLQPARAGITLRVVWEEQPTIHAPLLTWLRELTEDEDALVRIKAAQAIGVLATYDFRVFDKKFLYGWRTGSARTRHHELAAWALKAAACDRDMIFEIHRYLQGLARGSWGARSVVVRTYGSAIGVIWIDEALEAFTKVAGAPGSRLHDAVASSISRIYRPENAERILATLARWSADGDALGRRLSAALTFVRLLSPLGGRHRLLDLAAEQPDVRPGLVALWHHVLESGLKPDDGTAITPEAWQFLGEWVRRWDSHPQVRPILAEVLMTASPRLHPPLIFHLRLWRRLGTVQAGLTTHLVTLAERR